MINPFQSTNQFSSAEKAFLQTFADLPVAQGDVFYVGSDLQVHNLSHGTSGQFLTSGGVGANPTWSTSSGGSGTPGGSTTQIQYNNAGAFGGATGITTNGTALTVADSSADALTVGANGATNPVLQVNANNASVATGLLIKGAAAASGMALSVLSSGTNENLTIDAKGTGTMVLNGTATGKVFVQNGFQAGGGITSFNNGAGALIVGPNGATNPTLQVDSSAASAATGVAITAAAAGAGVSIGSISSATNESLTLSSKGSGNVALNAPSSSGQVILALSGGGRVTVNSSEILFTPATSSNASQTHFLYTSPSDTSISASTEYLGVYFNQSATRQHATGALALQRDFRISAPTYSFVGASTLTMAATFAVDGPPNGGTNATITNSAAFYLPTSVVANVQNAYGLYIVSATGGTVSNSAASFTGAVYFNDVGDPTKQATWSLSGATTATSTVLTLAQTANRTITYPDATTTLAGLAVAQTFSAVQTFGSAVIYTNDAITATSNAATVPITCRLATVTNNSAATLTITMTTSGATDGQLIMVRVYDFSNAGQTLTWVNTENSLSSVPTTSNGSTTLPLTVGFQFNGATSKWRCIAVS